MLLRAAEKYRKLADPDNPMFGDPLLGASSCELCKTYRRLRGTTCYPRMHCTGCPVSNETGKQGCDGTPYTLDEDIETQLIRWFGRSVPTDLEDFQDQLLDRAEEEGSVEPDLLAIFKRRCKLEADFLQELADKTTEQ